MYNFEGTEVCLQMVLSENMPHFQSPRVCFPMEAEPGEGPGLLVAISPGPAAGGQEGRRLSPFISL